MFKFLNCHYGFHYNIIYSGLVTGVTFFFFFTFFPFLGDGLTVPTKFSLFERAGEAKTSLDRKPRTDIAAFENGGELDGSKYITSRVCP